MSGWVKLHRKITEWEWYGDINTTRLFIHLLLTANHQDKNWRGIVIKRGQKLTSLANLASETSLSIKEVRTALKHLKSTNEVASEGTSLYTLLTINRYNEYQGIDDEGASEGASKGQARGKQGASKGQQLKNDKNEKNEKNTSFALNDSDESNSEPKNIPVKIFFNFDTQEWENITKKDFIRWAKAYPACDIERQLAQMSDWLVANPKNKKANYSRFIANWLSKAQQKGGDVKTNRVEQPRYTADMLPDL